MNNVRRRLSLCVIALMSLLAACGPKSLAGLPATETPFPPSTAMPVSAAQTPASPEIALLPGQLEIIQPGNVSRLQLLKTFPAEIPLQHSVVAISPDGKSLAIGSSSTSDILFIDLTGKNSSQGIQVKTKFQGLFDALEYLPDGTLLASSPKGYESYHIDANGNILATWGYPFAVSADGKTVAFGDNGTKLVDILSNEPLGSLEGDSGLSLSFSPDGSKLAVSSAGVDYLAGYVWDVESQTILSTLNDMGDVRFSPNGKFLVATGMEGDSNNLKVFDADGKTQLATLTNPQGLVGYAPLLSVDGQMILAQIPNGPPVAWETSNWQPLDMPALEGQLDLFSPDGRILITRADDGAILLWGVLP